MRSILVLALFVSVLVAPLSMAQPREIAPEASAVRPLLNGMTIPNVTVKLADGSPVSLAALTMQKPTVILFYRGGWCPYCNRQFAELQTVEQDIIDLGYQILAISPETPENLQKQALKTEMKVTQLLDTDLNAIREFGLGFHVDKVTQMRYAANNITLAKDADGKAVLPAPGVFIVNQKGQVEFSYVNPDFKVRPSAELILNVAKVLAK